ncbi:uncharacterized protein [Amphiura filiformis]|uniref:uncharacterized protein isoform X5 n=1 Tax=Amphiura filiformis TaxID=82378 RepID=UPI003B20D055
MIHNYMNLQVYKCTMERLLCSVWNSSACNAEKLLGYGRRCGGTFYFGFPGGKVCKIQLFLYVLMLMVLLCICGDGGASSLREKQGNSEPVTEGRKLKFPEPGIYESAEEFEEVITTEYGYSGFLASYDYPYYNYWDGDLYHYLLVADEGQIIELSFEEPFEIEYSEDCQYDALIVRDGRYGYSPPLARLCGHEAPPKVVSTGRYMSILFTTDEEVNGVGFFANYSFIDDPKTEKNISKKECHFNVGGSTPRTLSGFDGLIYSENGRKFVRDGAGNENDTIDCTWEINMPEYYKIMIEFDNFKLADVNECDKNRVEVYDLFSYNVEERMIRTYCSTTAPTLMTVGNRAFIHFYAQSKGNVFNVLYTAYRDVHKTDESSGAQMDDADNGCNKSVSFGCAEHMCIDYSLRCNGRKNCWNFGYDELDCTQVGWARPSYVFSDGAGRSTARVYISHSGNVDTKVTVTSSADSAAYEEDFVPISRNFTIPAQSTSYPLYLDILDDDSGDSFVLILTAIDPSAIVTEAYTTITIEYDSRTGLSAHLFVGVVFGSVIGILTLIIIGGLIFCLLFSHENSTSSSVSI